MTQQLVRGLTLRDAIAIVVGTIIGTGIFLKTGTMATYLHNPYWILLAWVVGGCLSFMGALTYAKLGTLFPKTGGEYAYLKVGYGPIPAFLFGWTRFWIGAPGSIAAYAVGSTTFLHIDQHFSLVFIIFFTILNCAKVSFAGKIQSFMTGLKLFMMIGIALGIFFFSKEASFSHLHFVATTENSSFTFSAFGLALLSSLWAYDGWNNLSMMGGEIEKGERNISLSLIIGMMIVLFIYAGVNLAYFYALPFEEILSSNSKLNPQALPVATKAAMTFLGEQGLTVLSLAFVFSALGAMNGSILTGARVPYAMAEDGFFFKSLSQIKKDSGVPVYAVLVQGILACLLALSGTFDQLTDSVIFSAWIFYGLTASLAFKYTRNGQIKREGYWKWAYPFLPVSFVLISSWLLVNTIMKHTQASLMGMLLIALGLPFFYYFSTRNK